jgi:PAS domain S-box-containing protein
VIEEPKPGKSLPSEGDLSPDFLKVLPHLLEHLPVGVLLFRPDGRILFANQAVGTLSGFPLDQLVGQSPTVLFEQSLNEDGSDVDPLTLPCRLAIQFNQPTCNRMFGLWNKKESARRWIMVNSIPLDGVHSQGLCRAMCLLTDVSQQVNTRQQLQAANALLAEERILFVTGDVVVFKWQNRSGWPVEYVSPNVSDILGYSPEELISGTIPYSDLILPEALPRVTSEVQAACGKDSERFVHEPYPIRHKNGRIVWLSDHTVIRRNPQGEITHFLGYIIDITPQVTAAKSLQESEERFKAIFDKANDGILLADTETTQFFTGNSTLCRMLGYSGEEIRHLQVRDIHPAEALPLVLEKFHLQKAGNISLADNLPVKRKDGSVFYADISSSPVQIGDRLFLIGIFRDITERKTAADLLRKQHQAMEQSTDGIVILSVAWIIEYANKAFTSMFRCSPPETIGKSIEAFQPVTPTGEKDDSFLETLRRGENFDAVFNMTRLDGTTFHARFSVARLFDEENRHIGYTAILHDTTTEEKLNERVRQSQKMEAIGHLAGGIAHDFNNLLLPIIGYSDLLKTGLKNNPEQLDKVRQIQRAAERAKELVVQLLAFSRKQVLKMENLSLNMIITDFDKMLRRVIRENIRIHLTLAPDLGSIRGDSGMIEQILVNLLLNAQEAIPGEGVVNIQTRDFTQTLTGSFSPELPPGEYILLEVSDNGRGMTKEIQGKAFEPFFSTKAGGTGLGLATVYGIVHQHDGFISLYSEPGHGTVFRMLFPRGTAPAIPAAGSTAPMASPIPVSGTETILVVEDNELVRNLTETLLQELGYRVIVCDTPQMAIQTLANSDIRPHLLLTDMVLPGMDGQELFLKIRESLPQLKVLFMSGYTEKVIVHQGILEGNTHFLQKPFSVQELADKIRVALGER